MNRPGEGAAGGFLLTACQGGAEAAVAARVLQLIPGSSRAAWRRGVVSFRLPEGFRPPEDLLAECVFARVVAHSLGQVRADDVDALAEAAVARGESRSWQAVHVWHRLPTTRGTPMPPAGDVSAAIERRLGISEDDRRNSLGPLASGGIASPGELVLDCLLDSPERAWVGWHRAVSPVSCWPGGIYPRLLPAGAISRAWLKLDEAIAASGLRLAAGERACELGAAPGGACQRLLEAGLQVRGVDPAAVDPRLVAEPRFEHWRMRARDLRRRALRGFDWLLADMNIDPTSTIAALERFLGPGDVRPEGLIITLKLPDWNRAAELPAWLAAFERWGYQPQARQLSSSAREISVVARRAISRRGG